MFFKLKEGSYDYFRYAIICHIPTLMKELERWNSL